MKRYVVLGSLVLIVAAMLSCASAPSAPLENYGANLDEVEAYLLGTYSSDYASDFREGLGNLEIALDGTVDFVDGKAIMSGGDEPHAVLVKGNAIRAGAAVYLRFKPHASKWFSISVESGEYGRSDFLAFSAMSPSTLQFQVHKRKGAIINPKPWTKRQHNFRGGEFLALFEIDFEGNLAIRIFDQYGKYNLYSEKAALDDSMRHFFFKVEQGSAELVSYKELSR